MSAVPMVLATDSFDELQLGQGDLTSFLNGFNLDQDLQPTSSFLGGDLALDVAGPLSFEEEPAAAEAKDEAPTFSGPLGADLGVSTEDDGTAQATGGGKRRRRIRNTKQQELNRLAQQRYRQRKKERMTELSKTVGTLQQQLDRLAVLEHETVQVKAVLQQKDATLQQRDAALKQLQAQLKAQQDKCAQQERQLAEQQQVVEQQRQQLKTSTLAGLDPQALSDRLLCIVKAALLEAGNQHGGSAGALASEAIVASISRTLTSCCRELVYQGKQTVSAETPKAIPVSCF